MSLKMGLLGRKIGMTQVFHEDGTALGVTAVTVGPCVVVGNGRPTSTATPRVSSASRRNDADAPAQPRRARATSRRPTSRSRCATCARCAWSRRTSRSTRSARCCARSEVFKAGDVVDVVGTTKGKGYQGVMKRHKHGR